MDPAWSCHGTVTVILWNHHEATKNTTFRYHRGLIKDLSHYGMNGVIMATPLRYHCATMVTPWYLG